MFQTFTPPAKPTRADNRIGKIRDLMTQENLDALIIPHADEQRNEYLPDYHERLSWISGFTGSAGAAVITHDGATLFVDGRYTLQAAQQTSPLHWEVESLIDNPPARWLRKTAGSNWVVGVDPWVHSHNEVNALEDSVKSAGASLKFLEKNPVDAIWTNQPSPPEANIVIHPLEYSGATTTEKLETMIAALKVNNVEFCVLTDPSSICWLFNIRGADVVHNPIVLAQAILRSDELPLLFVDRKKLTIETHAFLNQVSFLHQPDQLSDQLKQIAKDNRGMLDPDLAPEAMWTLIESAGGEPVAAKDPVRLPRAQKNAVELAGTRNAHLRDGASVSSFFCWLDHQKPGTVTEIEAAQKLETYRREMAGNMPLREVSFDTISGSGPNGAIVHYRVTTDSDRTLGESELYLCDSGGQYDDGTTDITRTVTTGKPTTAHIKAFTLVLRGHIALALVRFPTGTRGMDLDPFARMPLWQHGMEYAHGTGHGVGSYLGVHEGPQSISKRGNQELLPGMIVSNEPGYYREGEFGIRIENLVIVTDAVDIPGGDAPMLGFETITLAPIDQRLIDPTMMTDEELHWLNAYHGHVRRELLPLVSQDVADWLTRATEPMIKNLPAASA